jgi:acyl-coenzyme A synthetase/AMP-(fatty) acid ligase
VFGGRPFFPEDIRQALLAMPGKRVLVTTPIHLRACVASRLEWPELDMIISATAPLDVALAEQVEALFRTSVMEIYGCTEAGSMASRQTSHDSLWRLYDDFRLRNQEGQAIISAPHLDGEVRLGDLVEQVDERHFRLLGRHADMLNIAGKRASLNDLNLRLNAIPGVEDGVFVVSGKNGRAVSRLTALVVAPERTEQEILDCLARELDPVFLPRPLYRVDALPRNETGKLPRHSLLQLLERISARS